MPFRRFREQTVHKIAILKRTIDHEKLSLTPASKRASNLGKVCQATLVSCVENGRKCGASLYDAGIKASLFLEKATVSSVENARKYGVSLYNSATKATREVEKATIPNVENACKHGVGIYDSAIRATHQVEKIIGIPRNAPVFHLGFITPRMMRETTTADTLMDYILVANRVANALDLSKKVPLLPVVLHHAARISVAIRIDRQRGTTRNTIRTMSFVVGHWVGCMGGASIGALLGSLPEYGGLVGGVMGSTIGQRWFSSALQDLAEDIMENLHHDCEEKVCATCGRLFLFRRYKGNTVGSEKRCYNCSIGKGKVAREI